MKSKKSMVRTNFGSHDRQASFFGKPNIFLLAIIVALSIGVIYSTHQSRLLVSQKSTFSRQIAEQNVRNGQLMLEEGTFSRTSVVEQKAINELQLQKITLEQVVRVTP